MALSRNELISLVFGNEGGDAFFTGGSELVSARVLSAMLA